MIHDVGYVGRFFGAEDLPMAFIYSLFMTRSIYCKRNRIIPLVVDSMSNK